MHDAAESNGPTNGHATGTAVLERVKQVWAEADAAGEKRPGRGRLATLLDVKEHHVRIDHLPADQSPEYDEGGPCDTRGERVSQGPVVPPVDRGLGAGPAD